MIQKLCTYNTRFVKLVGFLVVCGLFSPLYATRRARIRKHKQQLAMLAEEVEAPIEQQLGIPQISEPPQIEVYVPTEEIVEEPTVETDLVEEQEIVEEKEKEKEEEPEIIDEIELYFENADLINFVQQIEEIFDITFITDDNLDPIPQGGRSLRGNKISYRTIKPISRAQAWNTFTTFLNIAGFNIIPQSVDRTYRIAPIAVAQKGPLKTYIGVDATTLPDSDELIRFVYFIENNTVDAIRTVIDQFRSSNAPALYLQEHKGFILTDLSYNIKKLMEIVRELDKISMPESLSVLKLRRADAKEVKDLYDTLTQKEQDQRFGPRPHLNRRQPEALALPENVTLIAEPRTNSLIILGPQNARERIEQFIIKNIDVELDQAYSPLHSYQLRYANAESIANIMNDVTQFGRDTEAGRSGGVRGGDQYMRPISFVAEPTTNRLIIKGHYDDYLKAIEVIKTLDIDQPQIAIEVLILSIDIAKNKELGTQLRSKLTEGTDGLLGKNVKFQTSGLFAGRDIPSGIVQKVGTDAEVPGVRRLLGNLLNLVVGAPAGNTVIALGEDLCGVWGIMQMLETVANVQLVSNPFLIATNNKEATVELGETRRVVTSQAVDSDNVQNTLNAFGSDEANLVVNVKPQINSDGMIVLDLDITIDNFVSPLPQSPTKNTKNIKTSATLANKQVLAIGGLVRNSISNTMSKTPLLGDIPILGWFFKNKRKREQKQNLLILVSTRIIEPTDPTDLTIYNTKHTDEYRKTISELGILTEERDPIHKLFFSPRPDSTEKIVDDFLFARKNNPGSARVKRIRKKQAEAAEKIARQDLIRKIERLSEIDDVPKPKVIKKPITESFKVVQAKTTPIDTKIPQISNELIPKTTSKPEAPSQTIVQNEPLEPINNAPTRSRSQELKSTLQSKKRTNLALTELLPLDVQQGGRT